MANIVTHGLGQPDEGSFVLAGLGATTPAPPGSISATLTGSGSITSAALAAEGTATPPIGTGSPRPRLITQDDYLVLALLDDDLLLV